MAVETLTRRRLNRALLARQVLLAREELTPAAAVERLVGMQAQLAAPPFVGLWTRLTNFPRESLLKAIHSRQIVRATLMRGTLHLFSARDYLAHRLALQPMLTKGYNSIFRTQGAIDLATLLTAARPHFIEGGITFATLRLALAEAFPHMNEREMGYAVRMHMPLVGAPDDTEWGYHGDANFTCAATWLGAACVEVERPHALVLRYLAAFGPATVADVHAWSGLSRLKAVLEDLRPQLATFRDERNRELFDHPAAPRPAEDVPAPVRYLPAFDNMTLSHDDRSRVISDEHRRRVQTKNGLIPPMFLVDGFVAGTWRSVRAKKTAKIVVMPFVKLSKAVKKELSEEGERLSRFISPDVESHAVEFEAE